MLSPREYEKKLCMLAANHAFRVIGLVTESLENEKQARRLMVTVLMALHDDTALQTAKPRSCRTAPRHRSTIATHGSQKR